MQTERDFLGRGVMNHRDMPGEIRSSIAWGPIAHMHSWEKQAIGLSSAVLERAATMGIGLAEVMAAEACAAAASPAMPGCAELGSPSSAASPHRGHNDQRIIQGERDLKRSLVHLPAQIRVSTVVKGFTPAGS